MLAKVQHNKQRDEADHAINIYAIQNALRREGAPFRPLYPEEVVVPEDIDVEELKRKQEQENATAQAIFFPESE